MEATRATGRGRHIGASFAPVSVVAAPVAVEARGIEVTLATGERLIIHEGVSVDFVRVVVSALRPSC